MGYVHYFGNDVEVFPEEFIIDVTSVIMEHINILDRIQITKTLIQFNGKPGSSCETFHFRANHSDWCKTGRFWVEDYDLPVCSVLLLAIYHLNAEVTSDGLATLFVNLEKQSVSKYWEAAIQYVKQKFDYIFERELYFDEYKQERIRLNPLSEVNDNDREG
ncbi:hypothetical protein [Niallia sp. Krafla_26]|uniref:hypothetical protein n=1 Tax=Niallia sp. Krafla_26 TaxID=3064703 RepID=UPI003D185B92